MTASCYSGLVHIVHVQRCSFGCTAVLGSASLAVTCNISTDFEDLICNHAMDNVVKNKLYYYNLNVVSYMTASCYSGLVHIVHV